MPKVEILMSNSTNACAEFRRRGVPDHRGMIIVNIVMESAPRPAYVRRQNKKRSKHSGVFI